MKRLLPVIILAGAAATLLLFPVHQASAESAGKKPDMIVYTGFDAAEGEVCAALCKKISGDASVIEVKKINSGKLVETLEKAGKNCEASVVFGGSLPTYLVAADKGMFMKYMPAEARKFDKNVRDSDGRWIGIYVGVIGFAVNGKAVGPLPESWEDLLKPQYKGKVAMANPNYSGTSYTTLSTLVQLMGEEKAFDYMKKLDKQIVSYPKSGAEPAKMAGRGETAIGICFTHDIIKQVKEYPNLKISYPKEGTGLEIGGAAIPLYAPNPALAKKFMDFLASPAAQNLYGTNGIPPRFPTNPGAKRPETALSKGKVFKLIDFDFSASAANEQRLIARWTKEIGEK